VETPTNLIPTAPTASAMQDSMAIHTAAKVLADEARATCKSAC